LHFRISAFESNYVLEALRYCPQFKEMWEQRR